MILRLWQTALARRGRESPPADWSLKSPPECSSPARNKLSPGCTLRDGRERCVLLQFVLSAKATSTRRGLRMRLTHCENKDFQALHPSGALEWELFHRAPGIDRCERAERLIRGDENRRASERRRSVAAEHRSARTSGCRA